MHEKILLAVERAPAVCALAVVLAGCAPHARRAEAPDAGPSEPAVIATLSGRLASSGYRVAALHADPLGRLHLVVEGDENRHPYAERLYYAVRERGRWSRSVPLSETPGLSHGARVAAGRDGRVHVLWYEHRGGAHPRTATDVLVRTRDAAGRWTPPVSLYREAAGFEPMPMGVRADSGSGVHVLHATRDRGLGRLVLARGRWWPAGFTDDRAYEPHWAGSDGAPAFAYVAAIPRPGQPAKSDVYVRVSEDLGWGEPLPIHPADGEFSHHPQLVVDSGGTWHAVWLAGRGGQVLPTRLFYASSPDGVAWTPPVELTPRGADVAELFSPRLALDRRGRLHLTFTQAREGISDHSLFYVRKDGSGWSEPERLFAELGYAAPELETALDGEGRLHLVWKDAKGRYRHAALDLSLDRPEDAGVSPSAVTRDQDEA